MYYLTKEDYARAKTNGISHATAYNRYYRLGYDLERALTEEPGSYERITPNMKLWDEWKVIAEKNGISRQVFFNRMNAKNKDGKKTWTAVEAATFPKGRKRGATLTPELYALAEENGIPKMTLRNRLFNQHWKPYRAATEEVRGKQTNIIVYDEELYV
jgi:hypothetical protein